MTSKPSLKPRKLSFWKRWLFRVLFVVTSLLTLLFTALIVAMPFLYEIEAESRGVLVYAMGMSLLLALVCGDSARRVYQRLRSK